MSLSQNDRISISKKVVSIPKLIQNATNIKAILNVNLVPAQNADTANKNLMDYATLLINQYQLEAATLDGNVRTQMVEQNVLDSANHVIGNYFNQNQPQVATPGLPSGLWSMFTPYSGNLAIGKNYAEVYTTTTKEPDLITAINGYITTMQTYTADERHSGQSPIPTGTCSLSLYTNQVDCLAHSGTWTPGTPIYGDNAVLHTLATDLVTAVNTWSSFIQTELPLIVITDTGTKQTQHNDSNIFPCFTQVMH